MTYENDPLSTWQKQVISDTLAHRERMVPGYGINRTAGGHSDAFGFVAQTFNGMLPDIPFVGGTSLNIGNTMQEQAFAHLQGLATNWVLGGIFRSDDIHHVQDRINQYLEKNGFIDFEFADGTFFTLPFFENPKITTSRRSNYASIPIVNRNEPYRLWTGAEAETINVSFNITLPHIMQFAIKTACEAELNTRVSMVDTDYKASFDEALDLAWNNSRWDLQLDEDAKAAALDMGYSPSSLSKTPSQRDEGQESELLIYVQHMIDLIRSSVVGSTGEGYTQAPPITYLQFGTAYKYSPFIVTSYKFDLVGDSGYDTGSLLPRQISIRLQMESFNQANNDTPQGWDSILEI